uniref:(northern house mosquito) hypothetical protein n=1 Tax=Culex pipiens TaxID=7175 RepID=A0A8D8F1G6_CULPI
MSISLSNHPFLNDDESMQYHSLMNEVRRGLLQCAFTTKTPTLCVSSAGDADLANKVSARDRAGEELVLTLFCLLFFLLFMMGAEAKWSLLRYCVMYFLFR